MLFHDRPHPTEPSPRMGPAKKGVRGESSRRTHAHRLAPFLIGTLAAIGLLGGFGTVVARGDASSPCLGIVPATVVLSSADARQQLAVTLLLEDGSLRDVTRDCRFVVEPAKLASITPAGVLRPAADGRGWIRATIRGLSVSAELHVDQATNRRPASFRRDVVPLLSKGGCNMGACHGNLSGKGGFRLSLRGDDPDFDFASLSHDQFGRRLNRLAPERSLAFLKPTTGVPHEGGLRFPRGSVEAGALLRWIGSGGRDDRGIAPRVRSLRVFPAERVEAPGARDQQLVVTAEFDDGTTRDVTRQAAYDLSDPTKVEVSIDGLVHIRGPGETTVAVRYVNGRAVSRLAFPADRPHFVWRGTPAEHPIDRDVYAKLRALSNQSVGPERRFRLHPPGLSRRDWPAPRPRRDPRLPGRS